jgi:serine/threonine protein kinase
MLSINEILQGRYRIIRKLGHGGMGAVYEAEDTKRFGKSVALKEILIDFAKIPNPRQQELVRRAFEREAKILTQLEDDAFPKVIEYFLETDRQFLVMELIPGFDLSELLQKRQKPFQLEEVLKWAEQLLDALDYLHTLNPPIIHRDIKPHNLKLNSRRRIKLLDFGIAKDTGAEMSSTMTNETFIGATLNYSPLEQLLRIPLYSDPLKPIYGEKVDDVLVQTADARSDIYALGATLYHLLTNVLPLDAYRRILKVWAGVADPLVPPHHYNSSIPPEISALLVKSMQVERENRFGSAIEMQTALKDAILRERQRKEAVEREKWFIEQEKLRLEREKLEEERRRIEAEHAEYLRQLQAERERQELLKRETEQRRLELEKQRRLENQQHYDSVTITDSEEEIEADVIRTAAEPEITQPAPPARSSKTIDEFDWDKPADTNPTMSATTPSYLEGIDLEIEKQEVVAKPAKEGFIPSTITLTATQKKPAWILPVAAIAVFLFGGVGLTALYMFNNSAATGANKPASNTTVEVPASLPNVVPSVAPELSPTTETNVVNSNSAEETPSVTPIVSETKPSPNMTTPRPQPTVERQLKPQNTPRPRKKKQPTLDDIITDN